MLHFQLLGGFEARFDDEALTDFRSNRLQAFLAYLLLHQGRAISRRKLAFLFWPDSTEGQSRTNLRGLLHALRRALPEPDRYLQADRETITWVEEENTSVDVVDFEQAAAEATTLEALQRAVELYKGELLPGHYEDWIFDIRARLVQTYQGALDLLVTQLEEQREFRTAIAYCRRLLQNDPFNEATYRRLMRLHHLLGDRAGALSVFQTCSELLERELGVEVSSETQEAYARIRRSEAAEVPSPPPARRLRHNLPVPLSSFIGRKAQLEELDQLLSHTRLLSLTGPGGSGKSRLAVELARKSEPNMEDGVWRVDLSAISDPAHLPDAVASVLTVRERADKSINDLLLDHLRRKRLLLLLDNCEHILAASRRLVGALLGSSAGLVVLATIRERLNVPGETVHQIPPLSLPPGGSAEFAKIADSEAVALFVERATSALPAFRLNRENAVAVAKVCRRLDGLPLAIELAAARTRALTPQELLVHLEDSFQVLAGGSPAAPDRHQTMKGAMDWSHDLLAEKEQAIFRRLAAFPGSWTLEAAENVVTDAPSAERGENADSALLRVEDVLEGLARLIDKSLVNADLSSEGSRYSMLETVRQYASELLTESQEETIVRQRHVRYFSDLARRGAEQLQGPAQFRWLRRLERELDNFRAALPWMLENGTVELALRHVVDLSKFWMRSDRFVEGREWMERTLAMANRTDLDELRAAALATYSFLLYGQGDYSGAETVAEESIAICERHGHREDQLLALRVRGRLAWRQGHYARARQILEEGQALAQEVGDVQAEADLVHILGHVALDQGEHQSAQRHFQRSLSAFREHQDAIGIATLGGDLGLAAYLQQDYATARSYFEENLAIYKEAGFQDGIARTLNRLGDLARCEGEYELAEGLYSESLALAERIEYPAHMISALHNLGYVALRNGETERSAAFFEDSMRLSQELEDRKGVAEALTGLAAVIATRGQHGQAAALFAAAQSLRQSLGVELWPANRLAIDDAISSLRGALDERQFAKPWNQGRDMNEADAISLAKQALKK